MADLVLAELNLGWPQLSKFLKRYERPIQANQILLADAVEEMLQNPHIESRSLYNEEQ